jgi:AbrB family looped-hinge helix DNA binding protein
MSTYKVDNQGRIVIPSSFRESQGIKAGTELVVLEEDGRLLVMTRAQAIREAQEIIRKSVPAGVSLVDDLLKERRREVAKEQREERQAQRLQRRHGKGA